jgi:GNAT superfamily N-acetyltransferase
MAKATKVDPAALKRESPGTYRTGDGRFTVQEASGRWMLLDAEEQDELGLPLTRGPFDTLADAKAALSDARSAPAPTSELRARLRERPRAERPGGARRTGHGRGREAPPDVEPVTRKPEPPPVEIRRYRHGDGEPLRRLWTSIGLSSLGDDDDSLDRMAERNAGLMLVATRDDDIVGSALGAWDGRRGWIYHVGTSERHRRDGVGGRLVHEVERKLRQLGCPKVNVIVHDGNRDATAFWEALGYAPARSRQLGKEL